MMMMKYSNNSDNGNKAILILSWIHPAHKFILYEYVFVWDLYVPLNI